MNVHDSDSDGRCPQCGSRLVQKASENGVFVCTRCGGSQLR